MPSGKKGLRSIRFEPNYKDEKLPCPQMRQLAVLNKELRCCKDTGAVTSFLLEELVHDCANLNIQFSEFIKPEFETPHFKKIKMLLFRRNESFARYKQRLKDDTNIIWPELHEDQIEKHFLQIDNLSEDHVALYKTYARVYKMMLKVVEF